VETEVEHAVEAPLDTPLIPALRLHNGLNFSRIFSLSHTSKLLYFLCQLAYALKEIILS
jgi:hypothetical protein